MRYEIQHRIETLSHISMVDNTEFSFQEIFFDNWDFLGASNFWLARGIIEASNLDEAINYFNKKLLKLIPPIAFISQCYTEFRSQSFLVKRKDKDFAFIRFIRDSGGVALSFGDEERKALESLVENNKMPKEFYRYWNDGVNSIGYSSKLLLLCAALEAIAKVGLSKDDRKYKEKFYQKIEDILGVDLKKDLWGTQENPNSGLRQRLVHGEYLSRCDVQHDYVDLVHKKIIEYFNKSILKEKLLSEDVIDPQRHIWGNMECYENFIRATGNKPLGLKEVLAELDEKGINDLQGYEFVDDATLKANY